MLLRPRVGGRQMDPHGLAFTLPLSQTKMKKQEKKKQTKHTILYYTVVQLSGGGVNFHWTAEEDRLSLWPTTVADFPRERALRRPVLKACPKSPRSREIYRPHKSLARTCFLSACDRPLQDSSDPLPHPLTPCTARVTQKNATLSRASQKTG